MFKGFELIGRYTLLMREVFSKPVKWRILLKQFIAEVDKLGIDSIWIVIIISFFMGAVVTMQMAINMQNTFVPDFLIGYATRDSILLEFSSSVVALILAGKVGSNIASEIGTMRITEQIDALEVMGVNSANYLIFPKVLTGVFYFPLLCLISMFVGLLGGYFIVFTLNSITQNGLLEGYLYDFNMINIYYALTKMVIFGFLITSISSFYGYYAKDNTLEVGRASTKAVVMSIIAVLLFNLIITKLFFNYN